MKYTRTNFPSVMKNLQQEVRNVAIDTLNALLEKNKSMDTRYAVNIAISRAKQWAREIKTFENIKPQGDRYYVTPHKDGWAVKCKKRSHSAYAYKNKEKAISTAKYLAKEYHADLEIQKADGTVQETLSY